MFSAVRTIAETHGNITFGGEEEEEMYAQVQSDGRTDRFTTASEVSLSLTLHWQSGP